MSRILDQGIDAVRTLPTERQDAVGELLLNIAEPDADERYTLTPAQLASIQQAIRQADRGELISANEVEASWQSRGV